MPFKRRRFTAYSSYGGGHRDSYGSRRAALLMIGAAVVVVVVALLLLRSRLAVAPPAPKLVTLSVREQILTYRCPSGPHTLASVAIEGRDLQQRVRLKGGNEFFSDGDELTRSICGKPALIGRIKLQGDQVLLEVYPHPWLLETR